MERFQFDCFQLFDQYLRKLFVGKVESSKIFGASRLRTELLKLCDGTFIEFIQGSKLKYSRDFLSIL